VITAQAVAAADVARSSAGEETLGFADPDFDSCDLLVVEDVQLLPAREADAFCSLLDRRQSRRRTTIVTSSAGPAGLRHLPRKLTSRLAAGLVLQLEPISRGSRRLLLDYAANARGLRITPDALDWLADQAEGGSARVLFGLIANIAPAARGTAVLDRIAVEQVLSGAGQQTAARRDVARIVKQVASAFGVAAKELLGPSRLRRAIVPRQVAMYLSRELYGLSLPRIGTAFGGRDHTTVLHACRRVEADLMDDAILASVVRQLQSELS